METGENSPQLDYAAGTTIGCLSLFRSGDSVVINVVPTWRRLLRPILNLCVGTVICAGILIGVRIATGTFSSSLLGVTIACVSCLVFFVWNFVAVVFHTISPGKWEANPKEISYTGRRVMDIVDYRLPRTLIAELSVEKIRITNQATRRFSLVVVDPAGRRQVISHGTREELEFLAKVFREVLGMPAVPVEPSLPLKPKWTRTHLRRLPNGVVISLQPQRIPWLITGLTILPLLALIAVVDHYCLSGQQYVWTPSTPFWITCCRIALATILAECALLGLIYRLRRRTTLVMRDGAVELFEHSLWRPAMEKWPVADVSSARINAGSSSRRASLLLILANGTSAPLLTNERRRDVQYIQDIMLWALQIARERQPPLEGEHR